ncbi:uncharacterized protein LOC144870162 [Branchiostoma floridae x Branchiostoma japonicum]
MPSTVLYVLPPINLNNNIIPQVEVTKETASNISTPPPLITQTDPQVTYITKAVYQLPKRFIDAVRVGYSPRPRSYAAAVTCFGAATRKSYRSEVTCEPRKMKKFASAIIVNPKRLTKSYITTVKHTVLQDE